MTTAWLNDLEEKVRDASRLLAELRAENEKLRGRVRELEAELDGHRETEAGSGAWAEEREEIRQRVEKLVEHLEELLGSAD